MYCGDGALEAPRDLRRRQLGPGDGCSGTCQVEPNFTCPTPGAPCASTIDLRRRHRRGQRGVRRRDRGRHRRLLGRLHASCGRLHLPGGRVARARRPPPRCAATGTAIRASSATTATPPTATAARRPARRARLHLPDARRALHADRVLRRRRRQPRLGEQCDDGNTNSRRRLQRAAAQLEPNFVLPDARPALRLDRGVRRRQGRGATRQCDDGNADRGDGCSATCQVEAGWACPTPGRPCVARQCGDGIVAGNEQCDDGNGQRRRLQRDCTLEPGYACRHGWTCTGNVCHQTTLRRRRSARASSSATTATSIPYDGCSPTCTVEPKCAGGTLHRGVRRRPQVPAARSATTATPTTATAAARPARSRRAGRAPPTTRRRPTHADHPDPLSRHALQRHDGPGRRAPGLRELQQRRADRPRAVDARRRQRAGVGVEHGLDCQAVADRRDHVLLVVPRDRLQRRRARPTPTTSSVYLDAAGKPTTLTLDADRRPTSTSSTTRRSSRSTAWAGTRAGAADRQRLRRPAHAQLLVHQRAALPVHLRSRARRRRSASPATTTSGCSSTATSPSTSAASTARLSGSVTLDAAHATDARPGQRRDVLDRRVPGRAPHQRVELQADAAAASSTP